MIFNKKKKRPPVINGTHLHTLTLVVHIELAFTELEGRKWGWREAKRTQWVADNGDKRSERGGGHRWKTISQRGEGDDWEKHETNRVERVRQSVRLLEGNLCKYQLVLHRSQSSDLFLKVTHVSATRRGRTAVNLHCSISRGACLIVILGQGMITDDEELIRKIHSNQGQGHLLLRRDADVMRWEEVLS